MKSLVFRRSSISFTAPENIEFDNAFYANVYSYLYEHLRPDLAYSPQFDADNFYLKTEGIDIKEEYINAGLKMPSVSSKASNPKRLIHQKCLGVFFEKYPLFVGLFNNVSLLAEFTISNAELLIGESVNAGNFIDVKGVIDEINRTTWTRQKDVSESQSGVSTLGTISETLLKRVFDDLVDDQSFFKVEQSEVQSYGDFVMMCLPNNLWLSVKSNFARERLLASGYTTDIVGVGFFQEAREFTNRVRIRNFQRAGFLAMYCPDSPVSEVQIAAQTNTYTEIMDYYGADAPLNINGKPFIRKLSELNNDMTSLLSEQDIRKRSTVNF